MGIRHANESDIPKMMNLAAKSWQVYKEHMHPDYWKQVHSNLADGNFHRDLMKTSLALIYENDGLLQGMIYYTPSGRNTKFFNSNWCFVEYLLVATELSKKKSPKHSCNIVSMWPYNQTKKYWQFMLLIYCMQIKNCLII